MVVQLGGQTPLKLAKALAAAGVPIMGTSPDAIDAAEDRRQFEALVRKLGIRQPPNGTADIVDEAVAVAERIGYPVLVRPSYVLGGRAMRIVYDDEELRGFFDEAARVAPGHPVLIDSFLEDAFEADVDAICDGENVVIGGVMQHIEDAGIHSGDSACVLPPYLITEDQVEQMREHTRAFARALGVVGLINAQYAIKDGVVYCLEVNPRASRTIPFVSKTTGVPLAGLAAAVMSGQEARPTLGLTDDPLQPYVAVKEAVFPFAKFPGRRHAPRTGDALDRRSDGDRGFVRDGVREGAGQRRRRAAARGVGVRHGQRSRQADGRADRAALPRARVSGSSRPTGRSDTCARAACRPNVVLKVYEGRPNGIDLMLSGQVHLLVNTPLGKLTQQDDYAMRRAALQHGVPYTTTMSAASAACDAIIAMKSRQLDVCSLQEWHALAREAAKA